MTTLRSGSATDAGRVRPSNEDWALENGTLFAVADGMGGHAGGEVASRTAVEALRETFWQLGLSTASLTEAVRQANQAVWERSRHEPGLRGMGTTLTVLALVNDDEEHLAVANVGDSRAYLYREGQLTQLTDDHSLVEEMVRSGELTTEDAALHPSRHVLTRALGVEPDVDVDVRHLRPRPGDRVLLCSDGLVNEVENESIAAVLSGAGDPGQVAAELVLAARAHGGSDNITAVVVDVVDSAVPTPKPTASATVAGPVGDRHGAAESQGGPVTSPPSPARRGAPARGRPPEGQSGPVGVARPTEGVVAQADAGVSTLTRPRSPTVAAPGAEDLGGQGRAITIASPAPRRITARVVAFVVLLLAVLAVAVLSVWWYANSSYFVGLAGSRVAIYQGRVGGLLWIKPHVVQRTSLVANDVPPDRISDVRAGMGEPSLSAARHYVANLEAERRALNAHRGSPVAPPPPTTTTTSVAG